MEFPRTLVAVLLVASSVMIIAADPKSSLFRRLKLEQEGPNSCWDALFELQSCSSEVVLFFLNGETHLGSNCCTAIRTIEQHCWPSMLGTIGITSEESDVLRGYCDATAPPPAASVQKCHNFPRLVKP